MKINKAKNNKNEHGQHWVHDTEWRQTKQKKKKKWRKQIKVNNNNKQRSFLYDCDKTMTDDKNDNLNIQCGRIMIGFIVVFVRH
jgi:hypothetical protein